MAAPAKSPGRALMRSPERCLRIISHIAASGQGLALTEIARRLEAPKTSVLELLRVLVAERFLFQTNGRYALGSRLYTLADCIVSGQSLAKAARPVLLELAERTGATAILVGLAEDRSAIVHLDKVEPRNALRYVPRIGDHRPLYCTASGTILLAYMAEELREAYIREVKIKSLASNTVSTVAALRRRIDLIRRTGMSVSINQSVEGVASIATPIFDAHDRIAGALAVALPSLDLCENLEAMSTQVRAGATTISSLLGCEAAPGRDPGPRGSPAPAPPDGAVRRSHMRTACD